MSNNRGPVNVGRVLGSNKPDAYWLEFRMETNGSSDPDGLDPDYNEVSITRTGTGAYKLVFDEDAKPYAASVLTFHEEDDADLNVVNTGYTRSSGEVVFKTYTNSTGTWSAADTTDKTLVIWMLCTRSTQGV